MILGYFSNQNVVPKLKISMSSYRNFKNWILIFCLCFHKKLHKVAIYKERCDGSFDSPKDSNVDSSDDKTDQKEVGGYEAQFNIAVASCFVFQFGFSKCVHSHLKIFSSN